VISARLRVLLASSLLLGGIVPATGELAAAEIPTTEIDHPPTAERLAAIHASAQRDGWAAQAATLRAVALGAFEKNRLPAASAWLSMYRWATLWAETEAHFIPRWGKAINAAGVGHPNMETDYRLLPRPLGARVSPELQLWLLGHPDFSAAFFELLDPVDYLPQTFSILNDLHGRDPQRFANYANLALAIALVYDVAPPPSWPHPQVSVEQLPRRWPTAAAAFGWWTTQDQRGRTFHKLGRLAAGDLKFVVDATAPFDQLEWSQQVSNYPLTHLERAYTMVRYRQDRLVNRRLQWPEKSYTLVQILGDGGICVDQAYFATQTGKARGVPTLFFVGAGNDGRHAWFGFLDENLRWRMDVGRYAEQKFVTGLTHDPQTWRAISDHELRFLAERFRALPSFQQSRVHGDFAAVYLKSGDAARAAQAARRAVNYERRHRDAWETLLAAETAQGRSPKEREGTLREAMLAFARYPDLEADYARRIVESLRARGETSLAAVEEQRQLRKYRGDRSDLSIQQAREALIRVVTSQPVAEQIRVYNATVDSLGRDAGIAFFDQIVVGFVEHLLNLKQMQPARQAAERARAALKVERGSQLESEFAALLRKIK